MDALNEKLAERIARDLGVEPESVTLESIRQARKELYAKSEHEFDVSSTEYGGYDPSGLRMINHAEAKEMEAEAEEFLKQFAS